MKKILLFLMLMISTLAFSSVEVSLTQDYSRSILTGSTKKSNEKVRVAIVKEVPKLHDWDYLYALEYQFKDKKNEQEITPQFGIRYYPVNFIPVFAGATTGVEIKTDTNKYSPMLELGIGIGREDVIGNWYLSCNENKQISSGIRLGYKFN